MADTSKPKSAKPKSIDLRGWTLHNGEGRPELQFPDPVDGVLIGGQVAAMRQSMRIQNVVNPWARRQGKSTMRQGLIINEAAITNGTYYFGLVLPDHATAFKIFDSFRKSLGGFVRDSKGDDKSQDRWIDLHAIVPPKGPPPSWFTRRLADKWDRVQSGDVNTGSRLYFWSGKHPHYESIQGFLHPFHRLDTDECQQVHPLAHSITEPMLSDVGGHRTLTGTPWFLGIGNVQFERFWNTSVTQPPGWFGMRIPHGTSPHVPRIDLVAARRSLSEQAIRQLYYAEFLSDAGAVFSNLDRVFVLKPLPRDGASLDWVRSMRSRFGLPTMEWWVSEAEPVAGHVYGLSVDWARSPKGDWSALTVFDFTNGRQVALLRWRGEDFTRQMEVVLEVQKHYGAQQLHADANGMGEAMADFLRRRHAIGFVGHKFGRNKPDYVRRGQILFVDADVSLINCDEQKHEFKSFSAHEREGLGSEKKIEYCAPEGEHDDMVAAFLHLAPTLTICGRQSEPPPAPSAVPMFDEAGLTTLKQFTEGFPLPAVLTREPPNGEKSWADVVLPPRFR